MMIKAETPALFLVILYETNIHLQDSTKMKIPSDAIPCKREMSICKRSKKLKHINF